MRSIPIGTSQAPINKGPWILVQEIDPVVRALRVGVVIVCVTINVCFTAMIPLVQGRIIHGSKGSNEPSPPGLGGPPKGWKNWQTWWFGSKKFWPPADFPIETEVIYFNNECFKEAVHCIMCITLKLAHSSLVLGKNVALAQNHALQRATELIQLMDTESSRIGIWVATVQ